MFLVSCLYYESNQEKASKSRVEKSFSAACSDLRAWIGCSQSWNRNMYYSLPMILDVSLFWYLQRILLDHFHQYGLLFTTIYVDSISWTNCGAFQNIEQKLPRRLSCFSVCNCCSKRCFDVSCLCFYTLFLVSLTKIDCEDLLVVQNWKHYCGYL